MTPVPSVNFNLKWSSLYAPDTVNPLVTAGVCQARFGVPQPVGGRDMGAEIWRDEVRGIGADLGGARSGVEKP